jgi:hypothetical protein
MSEPETQDRNAGSSHGYVAAEFDVGDKVRHRASGRIAIVTAKLVVCVAHHQLELCYLRWDRSPCRFEPTGRYNLSFDIGDDAESVNGVLLEPV